MVKALVLAVLCLSLVSCAHKHKEMTPELQQRIQEDLAAGIFPATCGIECFWSYMEYSRAMHSLYQAERWKELAELVVKIGYENDAAYYYLGRSAEELGHPRGAMTFYEHSIELSAKPVTRCDDPGYCYFNAASLSRDRLKYLKSLDAVASSMAGQAATRDASQMRPVKRNLTKDEVLNVTLSASDGTSRKFKKGKWTSGPFPYHPDGCQSSGCLQQAVQTVALGDLDGNRTNDGAFILVQNGQGPGFGYTLCAAYHGANGLVVTPEVFLGDRIRMESLSISGGKIRCVYLDRAPTQAMADAPKVRVKRVFVLKNGALAEVGALH